MLSPRMMAYFVAIVFIISVTAPYASGSWNTDEMQMFDLVEELKTSFYDFLNVPQTASVEQIKRAYRKLSIKMHPDKNPDDPEAEKNFRTLVGVYGALKDEKLRQSYDDVLENGLPSWRSSAFYFRKLRKMSNIELCGIFVVLCTVVHYAVLLGSRFEKSLTLEDQLRTTMKAHKARERKKEAIELEIAKQLDQIPRPKWHDILPLAILKGMYNCGVFAFELAKYLKHKLIHEFRTWREGRHEKYEEKILRSEKMERKRRLVAKQVQENLSDVYGANQLRTIDLTTKECTRNSDEDNGGAPDAKEWTEDELISLVRAISRIPGGVRNRWERIAEAMGRSVADVTSKAKQMGEKKLYSAYWKVPLNIGDCSEGSSAFETNENAVCGESEEEDGHTEEGEEAFQIIEAPSETDATAVPETEPAVDDDQPYMSRKKLKEQQQHHKIDKKAGLTEKVSPDGWTQVEQKQLEVAIRSIPKHVSDRWDQIAFFVPTKTKVEVLNRVKQLSSIVKSKSGHETDM